VYRRISLALAALAALLLSALVAAPAHAQTSGPVLDCTVFPNALSHHFCGTNVDNPTYLASRLLPGEWSDQRPSLGRLESAGRSVEDPLGAPEWPDVVERGPEAVAFDLNVVAPLQV
jgi:hypothetical protein